MDKLEIRYRRFKNKARQDVDVIALQIFRVTDPLIEQKYSHVTDYSLRKKRKDSPLKIKEWDGSDTLLNGNMSVDQYMKMILDTWKGPCNSHADIVIKLEEGTVLQAPSRRVSQDPVILDPNQHELAKGWVTYDTVYISQEDMRSSFTNHYPLFKDLIEIVKRSIEVREDAKRGQSIRA